MLVSRVTTGTARRVVDVDGWGETAAQTVGQREQVFSTASPTSTTDTFRPRIFKITYLAVRRVQYP